ncbi:WYL domain-containing protein [Actinomycetospora endophytica]|uniref:WYL domain-containing protein n=1 Tax=Actinomycetospora endophytica TaxID=2291215 RepID=A0ABS8P978_9PSEU|nr:WYL domain-containing protein [Actinomycetospora endophytica]MCD2194659.1 WYL domain-containing protein [Actinomycetospora endophytica]
MRETSARLLSLLSLLQARRDWPGQLLAERLDVSPRTVRRDVDRLRDLGYPVHATKGPDGGYRLEAGAEMPPMLFDDEQAVALALALRLATTSGAGIGEAAVRALTTVRQVMPARLRHRIDAVEVTAVEPSGPRTHPEADTGVLTALGAAVRAHEVLRFDHAGGEGPPRRVEPHAVVTWSGRWYLLAWDLDREAWRTFRADRITPRTPTGPRFTPREVPGGDIAAFVASHFQGGTGAEGWPCRGQVILHRPAGEVAPVVSDGVVEEAGPDHCRLTLGSWSWVGLAASVARFDADFRVVGPPELAAAAMTLAARYAAATPVSVAEPGDPVAGTFIGTQESDEVPMRVRESP